VRYDDEASALIIDDDFALPAKFFIKESYEYPGDYFAGRTQETRVFRCTFENRWSLSIIWGSMTYSDNKDHPHGNWRGTTAGPFVEEPHTVEVGIIMPEESTRPAMHVLLRQGQDDEYPVDIPEHTYELWGDPIGWVDAAGLRFLVGYVSSLDSHTWPQLEDGPHLNTSSLTGTGGPYHITYEVREEPTNENGLEVHADPGGSAEDRGG